MNNIKKKLIAIQQILSGAEKLFNHKIKGTNQKLEEMQKHWNMLEDFCGEHNRQVEKSWLDAIKTLEGYKVELEAQLNP